ncbi:MAG: hypothetical protein ACREK4_12920, partial [Candidatus Rokuibacteriota bacterium]
GRVALANCDGGFVSVAALLDATSGPARPVVLEWNHDDDLPLVASGNRLFEARFGRFQVDVGQRASGRNEEENRKSP